MTFTPLLQTGVDVDLPQAAAKPLDQKDTQEQEPIVVTVSKTGAFHLDTGKALDAEALTQRVQKLMQGRRDSQAYVRGDRQVDYGRVMEAMVILQSAGVEKIGLITEPPETKTRR